MALAWVPSVGPNLGGYEAGISVDGGAAWQSTPALGPTATSWIVNGAMPSTTYSFRIRAVARGDLAQSDCLTATVTTPAAAMLYSIAPPTGVSSSVGRTIQSDGTVLLTVATTWTASAGPNVAGYDVQVSVDGGSVWTDAVHVPETATSWLINGAVAATTYTIRVRARGTYAGAVSAWASASVATGALLASVPSAPAGVTVAAIAGGYILTWIAQGDPTILKYVIYGVAGYNGAFSNAAPAWSCSAPATNVVVLGQAATPQTVFLVAVNAAGAGPPSSGVNVTALSTDGGAVVQNSVKSMSFTWGGGAYISAGSFPITLSAAASFTITGVAYAVGDNGGSFTITIRNAGAPIAGLNGLTCSGSSVATASATSGNAVAQGAQVDLVIGAVTGAPRNCAIELRYTVP